MVHNIIQIMNATNDEELKAVFEDDDVLNLLLETGFCVPVNKIRLEDREAIVKTLRIYHSIIKVSFVMDAGEV